MTTAQERTRSLVASEELLHELLDPKKIRGIPLLVRERVRRILRHYPTTSELLLVAQAEAQRPPDVLHPKMLSVEELEERLRQKTEAQQKALETLAVQLPAPQD